MNMCPTGLNFFSYMYDFDFGMFLWKIKVSRLHQQKSVNVGTLPSTALQ